jgi:hypothetical protein
LLYYLSVRQRESRRAWLETTGSHACDEGERRSGTYYIPVDEGDIFIRAADYARKSKMSRAACVGQRRDIDIAFIGENRTSATRLLQLALVHGFLLFTAGVVQQYCC